MTDVPIPWCRSCRRRRLLGNFIGGVAIVLTILLTIVTGVVVNALEFNGWNVFSSCIVSLFVFGFLLTAFDRLGPLRRRGHTVSCRGFAGANPGSDGVSFELVFLNEKFASIWRSMN